MKLTKKQQNTEWTEKVDKDVMKTYLDQHREELLRDNVFTYGLALHVHINQRYKKELDTLSQKIKKYLLEENPEMADELKKLDFSVDLTLTAKKK